jgi:very-short-patch-repair endonuclease
MEDLIWMGDKRRSQWCRVTHGVHLQRAAVDDLSARLRAWQYALPFWSSFTGLTAAELRGWWLPPLPPELPLFVASGRAARISRPGLDVCRHNTLPPWELVEGVRVPASAETVLACARDLDLIDVVLIGDAALHAGDLTREQLLAVSRLRRRGAPLLRRAIPLMDGRAESIFEGLLRLLHVVCGIEIEPQHAVVDPSGRVIARGDLLLVGTRMLHEMDGGHHRSPAQQRRDLRRDRRLLSAAYHRRGFTASDILTSPVSIVRDAERSLGREHDPDRVRSWYSLVQNSLFTPSGRRRLELRVGLNRETAEEPRA